jgi:hypothetical protein
MQTTPVLNVDQLKLQARELQAGYGSLNGEALRRVRYHFADRPRPNSPAKSLTLSQAQLVIARENGFKSWPRLKHHIEAGKLVSVDVFDRAVATVIDGDAIGLSTLISGNPRIVHGRSASKHGATLLHYVAANGIEDNLQKTPPNAPEIARILIRAGAEIDALAKTYGGGLNQTTLALLVSSVHPAHAGVQAELVHVLAAAGAAIDGLSDDGYPLRLAIQSGYPLAAKALVEEGARVDSIADAAGLGETDQLAILIGENTEPRLLQEGLAFASRCGESGTADMLLKSGADIDFLWDGGGTAVHDAILWDRSQMVQFLVASGADLDMKHGQFNATPLDFASYNGKVDIVRFLLKQGADDLDVALESAVTQGYAEIADLLMQARRDR